MYGKRSEVHYHGMNHKFCNLNYISSFYKKLKHGLSKGAWAHFALLIALLLMRRLYRLEVVKYNLKSKLILIGFAHAINEEQQTKESKIKIPGTPAVLPACRFKL